MAETHTVLEVERLLDGEDVEDGQNDGVGETVGDDVMDVLPLWVPLLEPVRVTDTV